VVGDRGEVANDEYRNRCASEDRVADASDCERDGVAVSAGTDDDQVIAVLLSLPEDLVGGIAGERHGLDGEVLGKRLPGRREFGLGFSEELFLTWDRSGIWADEDPWLLGDAENG
jgi:hypothetical protein